MPLIPSFASWDHAIDPPLTCRVKSGQDIIPSLGMSPLGCHPWHVSVQVGASCLPTAQEKTEEKIFETSALNFTSFFPSLKETVDKPVLHRVTFCAYLSLVWTALAIPASWWERCFISFALSVRSPDTPNIRKLPAQSSPKARPRTRGVSFKYIWMF